MKPAKKKEEFSPCLNAVGQRSINSTLLFRNSNKSTQTAASPLSLSDFLCRKLRKNSVLPSSIQGKAQSVLLLSGQEHVNVSESRSLSDGAIYKIGVWKSDDGGKRKFPCEDSKNVGGKRLVVLGEGLKPSCSSRALCYNHYENGGGWWDDHREGVDNEELGSKDVGWEGFGTATF